jgi:hypothetical protein
MAPEVMVFRKFRDDVLLASILGSRLVRIYYVISPPLAMVISKTRWLRVITRNILRPLLLLIVTIASQPKANDSS